MAQSRSLVRLLNDWPVLLSDITSCVQGVTLHCSVGDPEVGGLKTFVRRIEYLNVGCYRTSTRSAARESAGSRPPNSETPPLGGITLPGRCRRRLLSGNPRCGGGSGQLTSRGVCSLLPPGGALAREARGRWPCPVFRGEAVAAAPAAVAAAAGTRILLS